MDKLEAYNRWHNPNHGFELQPDVNTGPRVTTENGILYQAEFCMLQDILGTLDDMDRTRLSRTVEAIQLKPGLYCRSRQEKSDDPATRRTISQDNIDGVVFGGLLTGTKQYAKDVSWYGTFHFGIYNNTSRWIPPLNPGNFYDWAMAAGFYPLAFLFLPIFIINFFIATSKEKQNTSSKKLYLLELYSLRNKFISGFFYRLFCKKMVKMYGENFISEIYKIYYPANHPLNYFAQGIVYKDGELKYEK